MRAQQQIREGRGDSWARCAAQHDYLTRLCRLVDTKQAGSIFAASFVFAWLCVAAG